MEEVNETEIATFWNEEHKRKAVISVDEYHHIVRCFEEETLELTRLLVNTTLRCAEDLAENYVEGYGEFEIASLCN